MWMSRNLWKIAVLAREYAKLKVEIKAKAKRLMLISFSGPNTRVEEGLMGNFKNSLTS